MDDPRDSLKTPLLASSSWISSDGRRLPSGQAVAAVRPLPVSAGGAQQPVSPGSGSQRSPRWVSPYCAPSLPPSSLGPIHQQQQQSKQEQRQQQPATCPSHTTISTPCSWVPAGGGSGSGPHPAGAGALPSTVAEPRSPVSRLPVAGKISDKVKAIAEGSWTSAGGGGGAGSGGPPPAGGISSSLARKKALAVRVWVRIDANGNTESLEIDKTTIMRRCHIPARDLRLLDPLFVYPSTILGREKAIVVNLEQIRALITADEVWFLETSERRVTAFVAELRRRLMTSQRSHNYTNNDNNPPNQGSNQAKQGQQQRHAQQPQQLQGRQFASEVGFAPPSASGPAGGGVGGRGGGGMIMPSMMTMPRSYGGPSSTPTSAVQSPRRVDSSLSAPSFSAWSAGWMPTSASSSGLNVADSNHHNAGSSMDMAAATRGTSWADVVPDIGVGGGGGGGGGDAGSRPSESESPMGMAAWSSSAGTADGELAFEFRALELALEGACSLLDQETAELQREAYPVLDELAKRVSTLNLEHARRLKSRLDALMRRVQRVRDEIEQLMDDDADMAEMFLTEKRFREEVSVLGRLAGGGDQRLHPHPHNHPHHHQHPTDCRDSDRNPGHHHDRALTAGGHGNRQQRDVAVCSTIISMTGAAANVKPALLRFDLGTGSGIDNIDAGRPSSAASERHAFHLFSSSPPPSPKSPPPPTRRKRIDVRQTRGGGGGRGNRQADSAAILSSSRKMHLKSDSLPRGGDLDDDDDDDDELERVGDDEDDGDGDHDQGDGKKKRWRRRSSRANVKRQQQQQYYNQQRRDHRPHADRIGEGEEEEEEDGVHYSSSEYLLSNDSSVKTSTTSESSSSGSVGLDTEELEMLLEAYFIQCESTLQKLGSLKEYIEDTEDYINIQLDQTRNQLILFELLLSSLTFVLTICGLVAGIFGMNLPIGLEENPHAFGWVIAITGACAFIIFVAIMGYFRYKRLVPL